MDQTKSLKDGSITTLRSSRGAVYLNPDGTFVYCTTLIFHNINSKPTQERCNISGEDYH